MQIDLNTLQFRKPSILVKRMKPPSNAAHLGASIILLPDDQYYKNRRCEVVATYPGATEVKPGDWVELVIFDGEEINLNGEIYELCKEQDILAVVEKVQCKRSCIGLCTCKRKK